MNRQAYLTTLTRLLSVFLALSITSASWGQIKVTESDEEDHLEIIEMTVTAAAQTSPLFKHRLTFLPHQITDGNAATGYLHALSGHGMTRKWRNWNKEFGEDVEGWAYYDTPREEIPIDKMRQVVASFADEIDHHVSRATRRKHCDWGYHLEELSGPITIGISLNALQDTRTLSRTLALTTKLAILESRFDDAVNLIRMNYRLAENVGRESFLVADLIGFAEIGITNGNMIDFIAAADAPNMYWALRTLPRPLVDIRDAIRMESSIGLRIFPAIANADTAEHSSEEWNRLAREQAHLALDNMRYISGNPKPQTGNKWIEFAPLAVGIYSYTSAKKRLVESGVTSEQVEKMAVGQVLLQDAKREYQQSADLLESVAYLPPADRKRRSDEVEELLHKSQLNPKGFGQIIAAMLLPATQQVMRAQLRIERDVDALLVIEALRMHAAQTGSFPKTLADVSIVPVPNNPATRKPFEYRLDGGTAVLELPKSDGFSIAKRFKISLRGND